MFENDVCEMATILSRPQCAELDREDYHSISDWNNKWREQCKASISPTYPNTSLVHIYMDIKAWLMVCKMIITVKSLI